MARILVARILRRVGAELAEASDPVNDGHQPLSNAGTPRPFAPFGSFVASMATSGMRAGEGLMGAGPIFS